MIAPEYVIPFNKPYLTGNEFKYICEAHSNAQLAGDGEFTKLCCDWLQTSINCKCAVLTHSCTAALEMAALLLNIQPGDEVIMPSYTFVSTANAFVMRGATPVFIDIREEDLNIDESLIENAISDKTRCIVPVHYAGVACNMYPIMDLAKAHNLKVIEDNAQGIQSKYYDIDLGSIGDLATLSFHETKNLISGEGGALLINDIEYTERALILRDKGTNRSKFLEGVVDKYSWVDLGSSYLPGELISAFLWAQMQESLLITKQRLSIWEKYHKSFEELEKLGQLRRPSIPEYSTNNAHMYYLILKSEAERREFIKYMKDKGIMCVFHYVPLHTSEMGRKLGRISGNLKHTEILSKCLVRLPLWLGVERYQDYIIKSTAEFFKAR